MDAPEVLTFKRSIFPFVFVLGVTMPLVAFGVVPALDDHGSVVAPLFLIGFSPLLILFFARTTTLTLEISPAGIAHQSSLVRWQHAWNEVAAWSVITDGEGEETIYFRTTGAGKIRQVNFDAVDEQNIAGVIEYFRRRCGAPSVGEHEVQPKWAKAPAWATKKFW